MIVKYIILQRICGILEYDKTDPKDILLALKILNIIFRTERSNGKNFHLEWFLKMNGMELVEELQLHKNLEIYELASAIVRDFGEGELQD